MIRALVLAAALASPAQAELRKADAARMQYLPETFSAAVLGALRHATPQDAAQLAEALNGLPGMDPVAGNWACQTMKLSADNLVIYRPFNCQMTAQPDGSFTLEKLTGSQRLIGTLTPAEGQIQFTGVGYVDGGPALHYDDFPERQSPVEPGQTVPVVGVFEQITQNKARLIMPEPLLESDLDILLLTR